MKKTLSRRSFLKLAGLGSLGLALRPQGSGLALPDFPKAERLGRVCVGKVNLKAHPDENSQTVGALYEDAVVPWLRERVGRKPYYINQRWVETPNGFIYSPYVQPVLNRPNQPVSSMQTTQLGDGMWAEVTVPYVDVTPQAAASSRSWVEAKLSENQPLRVYYGMVFWIDRIRVNAQGNVEYRINPNYYGGVDMLWAPAEGLRPITADEIAPIRPEVENKRVVVDVLHQTLVCYEGKSEVYFCRVSTGAKFDAYGNPVDKWSTPVGKHKVTRKYLSLQMSGGTTGASYDLPGIGWAIIFVTGGVAVHSTFWHNDFGVPRSHGCVNVLPQDAKWLFRWTAPVVSYNTGFMDITITGDKSTPVEVIEG